MKYRQINIFFLFPLLLLATQFALGQDSISRHYVQIGIGTSLQSLYDQGFSSMPYSGLKGNARTGYLYSGIKWQHEAVAEGGIGIMNNRSVNSNNSITNYSARAKYSVLKKNIFPLPFKVYLHAGLVFNNEYELRILSHFSNNAYQQEYHGLIGPMIALHRTDIWRGRNLVSNFKLHLPIMAWYLRPGFTTTLPYEMISGTEKPFKAFTKSLEFSSWNKYQYWEWELSALYEFRNKNSIELAYVNKFYRMESANTVAAMQHEISFRLYTLLK